MSQVVIASLFVLLLLTQGQKAYKVADMKMIPCDEDLMRFNTPWQEIAKFEKVGAEVQNGLHSVLLHHS